MMSVEYLSVWFRDRRVLNNVTLDFPQQSITALIGPSGCGKSTLLRALNRMNEEMDECRTQGIVRLNGDNVYRNEYPLVSLRRDVGMVFQEPNPFPMSVYENVVFGVRIQGEKRRVILDELAEQALRKVALWDEVKDHLDDNALNLSIGQQQRLVLARAIAIQPKVLLLDEPASALDPISTLKIEELIYELRQDYCIVLVTHNMQQAARISDYTAFLHEGMLREYGESDMMFTNPENPLTEAYITGRWG